GIIILDNDKAFGTYIGTGTRGKVNVDLKNATVSLLGSKLAAILTSSDRTLTNWFDDSDKTLAASDPETLYFINNSSVTFENVRGKSKGVFNFTKGTSLSFGIPTELSSSIPGNITAIGDIIFRNNTSTEHGGAITVSGDGSLSFSSPIPSLIFSNNAAAYNGGAIFTDTDTDLDFSDVLQLVFENNIAKGEIDDNVTSPKGIGKGGAIYAKSISIGDTTTKSIFTGNRAKQGGGAIYAEDSVTIGGTAIFNGNFAQTIDNDNNQITTGGGAIFSGGSVSFSANSNIIFNGNESGNFGGAIYAVGKVEIESATVNFIGNKSTSDGGAIFVEKDNDDKSSVTLSNDSLFADNESRRNGGAINSSSLTITQGGNTSFIHNRAVSGGAFYGNELTIFGNTSFIDNIASDLGGAAYITDDGEVNLNAEGGDISFTNNKANSKPNSLYLESNVALTLDGNGNIYFDDPILSGNDGGNSLAKSGNGFVQFVGENILNPQKATTTGDININVGTFRLAGNQPTASSLTTNGDITFDANTTLAGQGILRAGQIVNDNLDLKDITFGDGVTLDPDNDRFETPGGIGFAYATKGRDEVTNSRAIGNYKLDGNVTFGENITYKVDLSEKLFSPNDIIELMPKISGKLMEKIENDKEEGYNYDYAFRQSDDILISGDVTFNGQNPKIEIELNNWVDGTFELMRAESGDFLRRDYFTDADDLKVAGMAVGSRQQAQLYIDEVDNDGDGDIDYNRLVLVTSTMSYNKDLLWTGLSSNNQWDTTSINWRDMWTEESETYNPNDYVIFNGKGLERNNIDINNQVQVSGMKIDGGTNVFVSKNGGGGKIIGKIVDSNGQTVTGKLDIDTINETIISISTSFVKGTYIHNSGSILIGKNDALGKLTDDDDDESGMVYVLNKSSNGPQTLRSPTRIKSFGNTTGTSTLDKHSESKNWFYVDEDYNYNSYYSSGSFGLTLEADLGTTWTIKGNDGTVASQKAWSTITKDNVFDDKYYYYYPGAGVLFADRYSIITINGGMRFKDNIAPYENANGNTIGYGAIHLAGGNILNINSTNGNILFSGNYYTDTDNNSNHHNLAVSTFGSIQINISGSTKGGVFFDDPIQVVGQASYTNDLIVDFRTPNGSNLNGFVQFRGDNILYGNVIIKGGELRLADKLTGFYDPDNPNESESSIDIGVGAVNFILEKGAKLGGNGAIKVTKDSTIKLAGTVSPDSIIREWK
ncbi:MAG: hypothetical protein LBC74_04080, partial [Planctomycetaceae bacterium]|nr:hypothetical protein [Planctomycetaceae bacterium]